jgi:hypothetical protein
VNRGARGRTPAPAGAPRRAPGRRRARFGLLTLALVGTLALAAGVATGFLVTGQSVTAVGNPRLGEVVTGEDEDVVEPPEAPVVDREQVPTPPTAPPALAEPLDDTTIGPGGLTLADSRGGLLSLAVPYSASGNLVVVPGSDPAPHPERSVRTVRVEVEEGLEIDGEVFAEFVMAALNDPRGWGGDGSLSFARTDGAAQIRVVLATPAKVDAMCAPLRTRGVYSCGRNGHAAINHTRWVQATDEFTDFTQYRQYVVNHEVGHLLGRPHVSCPAAGRLAPIMQQQSIKVAPCLPNAWPYPTEG